ncbi:MAG: hypothetical protein LBK95_07205 [Bifidobacteriaceae bacterium]|nr:hypothetical protein [Bifidobacteriaceae bacterium]
MATKVRKTLTLDQDLVAVFAKDPGGLSASVNTVLREEMERIARAKALAATVDDLDEQFGEPDPALVEEFRRLIR